MGNSVSNSNVASYPSLEQIMNLARSLVNDTQAGATNTPGEGNILTDNTTIAPFTQQFLNSAIRAVYRELSNVGDPELLKDNVVIAGLTPINGPNGLSAPDPSIQVYLSTDGYFDGSTVNTALLLPSDCKYPIRMWERLSGTNNNFSQMRQPQDGLDPCQQNTNFGYWEWRENKIYLPGATETRDVRLRYVATLPTFFGSMDYANAYVPIQDSLDAVAYKVAHKYATMLGSEMLKEIKEQAVEEMRQLKNAITRRAQSIEYNRAPFGGDDSSGDSFSTLGQ